MPSSKSKRDLTNKNFQSINCISRIDIIVDSAIQVHTTLTQTIMFLMLVVLVMIYFTCSSSKLSDYRQI